MKCIKNFLKYKYILLPLIIFILFSSINVSNIKDILHTNLYQGLKLVKVTEEKVQISEKKILINVKMPEIHYYNEEVARYINSYIRRNINDYINHERQLSQIDYSRGKININIDYHIVFENRNLLNIVIYREIKSKDNNLKSEKDSYIFDLNTGQRIFLNNLLKENEDYNVTIKNYINKYIKETNLKIDKDKINIDKYTNYEIIDEGINIYFNPYRSSENNIMKFFNESQQQAKDYYENIEEVENKFVANVDYDIKKNSDNILSIMIIYYKFAGGAHGDYEHVVYNIDMKNGKFISLSDLFKEKIDYKTVINEEIRKQIEDLIKTDKQNKGIYEFEGISDKQKFYIQDDNLVIYFDLYEIAPYAAGIPEFIINVNKIDHILKTEYKNIFK